MKKFTVTVPGEGQRITIQDGKLQVPDNPIIPFVEGDGAGIEIWQAASRVFNAATEKAYKGQRKIHWMEVLAGGKAFDILGTWLPDETVKYFRDYLIGIKGPLTTPVGGGIRSLNVALRKYLDLYVCLRPVRYFQGVPSPIKNPSDVDIVIFRENTEDIYTGIEFENGSQENQHFKALLKENFPNEYSKIRFPDTAGIGVKPISKEGSLRLIRAAIQYALENHRRNVTLVHKGNIMKYTEGAFLNWGYELAEQEFGERVYTWAQWNRTRDKFGEEKANHEQDAAKFAGKLIVKDIITDNAFQQTILYPKDFDVIATMNLNGDYISDSLAALVGGIGIAPGGNINYETGHAIFEATHGTAPQFAGKDMVNPGSVILSGEMMLRYMGWHEAADLIIKGVEGAIAAKTVTFDFANLMDDATLVKCSEFGEAVVNHMQE